MIRRPIPAVALTLLMAVMTACTPDTPLPTPTTHLLTDTATGASATTATCPRPVVRAAPAGTGLTIESCRSWQRIPAGDLVAPDGEPRLTVQAHRVWAVSGDTVIGALRVTQGTALLTGSSRAALTLQVPPQSGEVVIEAVIRPRLLRSVAWVRRGRSRALAITPTWVSRGWPEGVAPIWRAVASAAPEADSPGMRDQLACHVVFAPDKATWDIEPARPAVGWAATVRARCNPGQVPDG